MQDPFFPREHMPLDNSDRSRLEARLGRELRGEVLFDAFSRGRYATDASIYQIEPLGVVVPMRPQRKGRGNLRCHLQGRALRGVASMRPRRKGRGNRFIWFCRGAALDQLQ